MKNETTKLLSGLIILACSFMQAILTVEAADTSILVTSVAELSNAYKANAVAADMKYKGKKFQISGTVAQIKTGISSEPIIELMFDGNEYLAPQFYVSEKDLNKVARLKITDSISMVCLGNGSIGPIIYSKNCELK